MTWVVHVCYGLRLRTAVGMQNPSVKGIRGISLRPMTWVVHVCYGLRLRTAAGMQNPSVRGIRGISLRE